eukprot:TRINITY_DN19489_c0_g1_i1.p1 TRINITY_DN19489_c0_g1~~TRINITY_DN19489_c0_g1_i1.p1  ORF type:complete len:835 (-),score=206.49 TRINITY_DN19489_c0_g1_i1:45-2342(-)
MEAKAADPQQGPELLLPGQVVQGFEIVKPLGKGKFSIVYMAKQLSDGTMCAVKKINIFDMMVPKQREKCLKEVKLLQSLDHPNIVKFLSSFVDHKELLIIVEWAEKGDLKKLLRRAIATETNFSEPELWEYSRQLSSALEHMHGRRIMHRDLKPANIFVAEGGALKLGDLGLGRFLSSRSLEAFSKVGTPLYMSPEVLHGAGYDMRSDVWSLGCVLYELAQLRSPFKSEQQLSLYDLFIRISKGQYPPLPDTVSADFRGLITRMLQTDPSKRVDCAQVLEACDAQTKAIQAAAAARHASSGASVLQGAKLSRPSPLLVMDDIIEKLKLLESDEYLLRAKKYPHLHRCFFAQLVVLPDPRMQFQIMYDIMNWVLGMLKDRDDFVERQQQAVAADASAGPSPVRASSPASLRTPSAATRCDVGAGDAAAGGGVSPAQQAEASARRILAEDPAELVRCLIPALASRGIQVSSETTMKQLRQGYGEGVCLILNELINQELVARDFHFERPDWSTPTGDACNAEGVDEVEEDFELMQRQERSTGSRSPSETLSEDESVERDGLMGFRPRGESAEGSGMEPIHMTKVDAKAWREEVERVRPLLRLPADLEITGLSSPWEYSVTRARQLANQISRSRTLDRVSKGGRACCLKWRDELARLQALEDRLNVMFGESSKQMATLRDDAKKETESITAFHESIAHSSEVLQEVRRELEDAKAEIAGTTEVVHDAEMVPRMRQAIRKVKDEVVQLDLRIGCLQRELLLKNVPSSSSG